MNVVNNLINRSLLARNIILNLVGMLVPLVVAVFAIPLLIKILGTDRFGVLSLAWVVIGYFSLFDFGLGRALTQLVSKKLGAGQDQEVPALIWTALFLMVLLGIAGTVVMGLFSPWLVYEILNIPEALRLETLYSFYLLSISIPLIISTAGMQGILKSYQRFGLINSIRIPLGVFIFAGPLLVLPFSQSLFPLVSILVVGLLIAWGVHFPLCFSVIPALRHGITIKRGLIGPLFRFGSWMTVTNIVGPLMVYLDRFLIGALASMTAVAYYTTPYEVVTKFGIIPAALVGVLFPAFSSGFARDSSYTARLFGQGVRFIFLGMFPIILFIVTFAHESIDFWLGAEFAQNSSRVLQWLAAGVFINSLAQVAFAMIQGAGRPDLTAKLHLLELPFYLLGVYGLINKYGIEGAAIAWVTRIGIDAICLFVMVQWFLPINRSVLFRKILPILAALLMLALGAILVSFEIKLLFLLVALIAFTLGSWFLILNCEERLLIVNRFRTIQIFN
ncbi:MAG TPA: flippase [Desulfatiglandales bacterium]|nr:flippase [Desulfatiglandales bacterium]